MEAEDGVFTGVVIGWSCPESREMISIEVEADNAPPFYLLACFPTVNAYNRLRMHRAVVINWLVLFDFARHYGKSFRNGSGSFRPNFLQFRIVYLNFVGQISLP